MAALGGEELPPMDPTLTSTPIPEPDMPLDSNTPSALSKLNVFVIVVPVLLATGIVIWGTLVLLGIMQRRRHLRSVSAWSSPSGGEKARVSLLKKPVLLDVRLPYTSHASSTERIHPISVEFLKSSSTRSAKKGHKHRCFTQMKENQKHRRQMAIATETDVPPKPAQITVLIAMPTANRNHPNKWDNCDFGTRRVLYKDQNFERQDDEEFELEEKTGYHISHREHHHTDSLSYYIF